MKKALIFLIVAVFVGALLNACASTKLTKTWVEKSFKGKTVSNVLVIGVADEEPNRRLFERKFVQQLKAVGVEAFSSADIIPIPADKRLEKEAIVQAVNKFKSDAVLITYVAGINNTTTYRPATYGVGVGYYGRYRYVYGRKLAPSRVSSHTKLCLETNLYDIESENLIWAGQSQTKKTGSVKKLIDGVMKVVVKDMQKNKLLPKK